MSNLNETGVETTRYDWHERRLGRTILQTRRATVDIDDVVPSNNQPRLPVRIAKGNTHSRYHGCRVGENSRMAPRSRKALRSGSRDLRSMTHAIRTTQATQTARAKCDG